MKLFWRDGRLAWPFVVVVAYLAAAIFLFDLAWRVTKMPIEDLLAVAAVAFAIASILLGLAIRFSRGRSH